MVLCDVCDNTEGCIWNSEPGCCGCEGFVSKFFKSTGNTKDRHYYRMTEYLGCHVDGKIIKCYTEEEMLFVSKANDNKYELIY